MNKTKKHSGILIFSIVVALLFSGCTMKPDIVFKLSLLAEGFVHPVSMAIPDDGTGRIFIVDQIGKSESLMHPAICSRSRSLMLR
jgi:hypothetical protein